MNKEEAQRLLDKYIQGSCTPEEKALVERWYLNQSSKQSLSENQGDLNKQEQEIWKNIAHETGLGNSRAGYLKTWLSAAAAVLVLISAGFYFFVWQQPKHESVAINKTDKDVSPGGNKAVLTLADGSRIVLDGADSRTVAKQGDVVVKQSGTGVVVYDASDKGVPAAGSLSYNMITTPVGGQYQVILPDRTRVWLNAASSIRFPTSFSGNERNVTITGEAYFEVTKNTKMPFKVQANGALVQVLGTHFNVMAYDDESSVKTTLIEGSVKVSSGKAGNLLKPGEQAQIKDENISVSKANIAEAVAWKDGYFYFKDTDIKTVMRQISRWYNVDVRYTASVPETVFTGKMYRNVNVSKVLEMLTYFKVNFRIEDGANNGDGKKTIVIY